MMKKRFRPLLNRMLMDLVSCWQNKSSELLRVESAYMITSKFWAEAKSECWQQPFASAEEEIDFFRNVKYEFTGRMAYYAILYEALISLPNEAHEVSLYWEAELNRIERFKERHRDFVDYMEKGEVTRDHEYFLRKNLLHPIPLHARVHDGDPDFSTSQDHLVSAMYAETSYHHYVTARVDG